MTFKIQVQITIAKLHVMVPNLVGKTKNQMNTVNSTLYSNGMSALELHEVLRVVVLPALAVEHPHFVEELWISTSYNPHFKRSELSLQL